MGHGQWRMPAGAGRDTSSGASAAGRRGRFSRIVLATAGGLALLSGAAASAPAVQAASAAPQLRPAASGANLDPCPCTLPICRPGCSQV
jgi:hypothetical protein